jgi:hypothetical protein
MARLAKDVHHKNANQPFFLFSPNLGCGIRDNISATESTCGEDREVFPIINWHWPFSLKNALG